MPLVIKYKIADSLAGNLRIIEEPFLKMALEILFFSVVAILKPLESKFGKLSFICKKKIYIFFFFTFCQFHKLGGKALICEHWY